MTTWLETLSALDSLEDVAFDPALVAELEARSPADRPGSLNLHVPGFKTYATSEITGCGKDAWPAVSITGGDCKLQCDHCKAKILEPMIAARTPEALWRLVNEHVGRGAHGMLLSGGSNLRDEVEYGPFYPVIRRIKDEFPEFRIALHTALVDRDVARSMEQAGVDAAMMDVIGAQDTITQVYHLQRHVEDFEASLTALTSTTMKVVPHIVIGLHYGRLLGEWHALEIVRRHRPAALVLVVVMPFYAPATRPFEQPSPRDVGRYFVDCRAALPDIPVLLGCARPAGRARSEIDAYAVMAALDGIAHPADGMVELATKLGRAVRVTPVCCSISVGEAVFGVDAGSGTMDVAAAIAAERARRRPADRLARIPIVVEGGSRFGVEASVTGRAEVAR